MSEATPSEREFFRAKATLRVFYGPESLAGRQAMAMDGEMWSNQSRLEAAARQVMEEAGVDESHRPLLSVMRWMDFKLDLVLHHLRLREQQVHFPHQATTTDVSGSGLGLDSNQGLTVGQRAMLALYLPEDPSRPVYAVAEVVRVADLQYGAKAAFRFLEIAESDRERVIRFGFDQQRRALAQRMTEGEA